MPRASISISLPWPSPMLEVVVKRAIVFANVRSGRGRSALYDLVQAARETGVDLTAFFDLSDAGIARALSEAERLGTETVLAAGGDGTVGTVAGHLIDTEFSLGVIPGGTSNDFARSLSLPMDINAAFRTISEGARARVDAGNINGKVFVQAAIAGAHCDFAEDAARLRKWVGRLSYPLATVHAYAHRQRRSFRLNADGTVHAFDAYEVAFVNAPVTAGPLNLRVAAADLHDGHLGVLIIQNLSLTSILHWLPSLVERRIQRLDGLELMSVREAVLTSDSPLPVAVDGDVRARMPADIRVLPGALTVYVPPSFAGSRYGHS